MTIFLSVAGLIYTILLAITFFRKDKVDTNEIKIYSILIIVTLVSLISELIIPLVIKINIDYVINFALKLYLVCILIWTMFFTIYVYSLSKKINKKLMITYFFINVFLALLLLTMPIELHSDGLKVYSHGSSVDLLYNISGIYIFIMLILVILDIKHIRKKQYVPVLMLITLLIVSASIQNNHPEVLLINFIYSFIIFMMYHTIENPDVKMIKKLEQANIEAEKANRAKTDFLSSMSHEIRTPLNAIIGFSDAIKQNNTVEECHKDAEDIIMASQNLLEIINGVLDISKIEANKMEIVNVDYNLKKNCENITKLVKTRIGEKPIDFRVSIASDIPDILHGDSGKIKEVITNILTNAVKYTEKGFVEFKVSCINQKDTSTIFISVEDSGRGIKKENLQNLFTKFQRLDEDKNTTIEGTGLGLAITKSLVDMMGGKIIVQSKYGEGSKFSVYLKQKIVAMVDNSVKEETEEQNMSYENKKVLIVDDNMLNLKVAARLLKEFKLEPELLNSGFECLDKINAGNTYDLILMDDMMPKMSGVETFKKLKEIDGFNIPVVILTANAISGMKEKYLEDGFDDYLAKPIDKNELRRVFANYLNGHKDTNKEKIFEELPNDIYDMSKDPNQLSVEEKNEEKENLENTGIYDITILEQNGVDVDGGINLLGDITTYDETIKVFLEENVKRIPEMKKYIKEKNMPDYAVVAHAIKSDSKYLGFKKLAEIALNHELKAKENDYEYVVDNLKEFLEEINSITKLVKKYLKK